MRPGTRSSGWRVSPGPAWRPRSHETSLAMSISGSEASLVSATIDTEHFRKRLLDERSRVQEAIDYLHEETPRSMEDETQEIQSDNHPGDMATATLDREIDYTLEENEGRVLAAIDAALKRIENGTFGICRTCGKPIGEERLEALPYTTHCIDCKRKEERG